MKNTLKIFIFLLCSVALYSCSGDYKEPLAENPQVASHTKSGDILASIPPVKEKPVVAVYEFQDQTGQMKESDTFANYSRAVTQGGLAILNKALLDAANGHWFTVIERGNINHLLQERQIIKVTRAEYAPGDTQIPNIKPMLYAGLIIEGGIVAYDSNITTGGAGAKYLGVGGSTQYRRDIVTIYLRAISSQTGEVLTSVNTTKTIYSLSVSASAYRYVSFDKLLELEAGFAVNEPPQFAVRQAIEMGVYSLIMEGAINHLWEFKDPIAGRKAIADYLARRSGNLSAVAKNTSAVPLPPQPVKLAEPVKSAPVSSVKPADSKPLANTTPAPAAVNIKKPDSSGDYLPNNRYSEKKYNWFNASPENCDTAGGCNAGTNP